MSITAINTNTTAMTSLANLQKVNNNLSTNVNHLSSGLKINSAKDDPSGLTIAEGMTAQINGMTQATSNAQDANNLLSTADGALGQVSALLQSIRTLAVHAANTGANDDTAAAADQTQIQSALDSITSIATQTTFGNKNLLNGSAGLSAAITNSTAASAISLSGTFNGYTTQAGNVTVTVTQAAARASSTLAGTNASYGATVVSNAGSLVLNGQTISVSKGETIQSVIDKINAQSDTTGVSAGFSGTSVVLTQQSYGSGNTISYSETASILNSGGTSTASGTSAIATVSVNVWKDGSTQAVTATFTGSTAVGGNGLSISDKYSNSILLTEGGGNVAGAATKIASASGSNLEFQVGSDAGQTVQIGLMNAQTSNLGTAAVAGKSLADIDVTTASGAAEALNIIDAAIAQVATSRASLGAFQTNTLDSAISYLEVGTENMSAAKSQIVDTDYAAEIVDMTKNQIIEQTATSVTKTSNSLPQQVLSLLG